MLRIVAGLCLLCCVCGLILVVACFVCCYFMVLFARFVLGCGLLVARFVGFVDLLMGLLFVICYFAWVLIIDAVGGV